MQGPAGEKIALNVERDDSVATLRSKIEETVQYSVDRMVFGTAQLEDDELTMAEAGLECNSVVSALVDAEGGKRKRKKKPHTTPKIFKHVHKQRKLQALQYFNVEADGKIKKLKQECPDCPPATYMAEHPDRFVCGRCGKTFFRLTKDKQRMPIPKQNKPAKPRYKELVKKEAAKKGGKKK